MVPLEQEMSKPLAETIMIQEQLGFALNRSGKRKKAEKILLNVIKKRGPSSETLGPSSETLGPSRKGLKDQWKEAHKAGKKELANGFLEKALDTYFEGFETDWRDVYSGVNAATLSEI
tara:strand:- start:309 stop:662 length:354 start_codon:yes stop_codon:yes gene_type:complete